MTPWTVAHQAPPSMGFSRQEYWSGLPFPSPGDLPGPGIEPGTPAFQADALTSEPPGKPIIKVGFMNSHNDWLYVDVLYLSGLEPNPQYLRGIPIVLKTRSITAYL